MTPDATAKRPLWLLIEEKILELDPKALSGENLEASIQRIAGELDSAGFNFSRYGGNMIKLRFAVDKMRNVGRPFLKDFNDALSALTLDDVADPYMAATNLIDQLGNTWPDLRSAERRPDVIESVENTRLNLLIAKAKGLADDKGIRLLIEEAVDFAVITRAMEITDEKLKQVNEQIKEERAEKARVVSLLEKVADKTKEEKTRYLFDNSVSEELIIEIAKVDQGVLDAVKKSMEEEMKEKQRLAEEEAARKKAEAEGPALENIKPEELLAYIESIREIMEFSDQEKEIRTMCEQSSIPKALVDIAVSEPDKLDELEKKAGA
jgi:DNA-binding transcriptional regulator YbjK